MKRVIVIGEGPTEQEFCTDVLYPYFVQQGILIENPKIKLSKGGIVPWPKLKREIEIYLKNDTTAFVTTLIDYYGIHGYHKFPEWDEAHQKVNKSECINHIESAMGSEVNHPHFIPYIQMHEFEALIFSDTQVLRDNFEPGEFKDIDLLEATENTFDCPEDINNNPATAPSKRLKDIFITYNKVQFGSLILQEIGLNKIREKCPRFDGWIRQLESV
ncbi:MAG: DUF4276 family protein [Bacteroidota bacterium]